MNHFSESDSLEFTNNDSDVMFDTVDNPEFREQDAELIYVALRKKLVQRPFGDHLKRYIWKKAEMEGSWRDIPLNDYRDIIMDTFAETGTPASFTPNTSRLSALSKNWLTQSMVDRKVVFLLGFGLRMSAEDVSEFLIKALHERDINPKDPFELICWYCYRNHYGFSKYLRLWDLFEKMPPKELDMNLIYAEKTIGIRSSYASIHDDAVLLSKLSQMKTEQNLPRFSYTARLRFERLFLITRTLIAAYFTRDEEERVDRSISQYLQENAYNARLGDIEKKAHIRKLREEMRVYTEHDVSAGDVEKVICSAIPMDRNGNLIKSGLSTLNEQFSGRRFNRQRISAIIHGDAEVDRFDLITMNFFIFSQKTDELPDPKTRFLKFVDNTNEILNECSMGVILMTNPYECFVMMCMLSEDPLGTYADVLEMSYESEDEQT